MKNFKINISVLLLLISVILVSFCGCKKQTSNLICCVENPLTDLEWLKNYCENVHTQDVLIVKIDLYKLIGKNEHVFEIFASSFIEPTPEQGNIGYLTEWRTCSGELVFNIPYPGTPPNPITEEDFMKDKEFVSTIFSFVKQ